MQDGLVTTKHVAQRLGLDLKTVRRYIKQGKLKASRIGRDWRISESSLNALIEAAQVPPDQVADRTARITAVVNQKGGVGKTTTTFNLGAALKRAGRRVLLVDLDPQAALSASAGIPIAHLSRSIYQALLDDSVDPATLIHHALSGVDVLPATLDLAAAEIELVNSISRELILKDVLAKVSASYDHVLIDCPPSLGLLTVNALAAADQVLIPVECDFLSVRGLSLLLKTLEKIRSRLNRGLRVAGILPTKFNPNTTHSREILAELKDNFPGQVFGVEIRQTVRLREAPAAGLAIFDYDRKNPAADAYAKVAREVDHG